MKKNIRLILSLVVLGLTLCMFSTGAMAEEGIVSLNKASLEELQTLFDEIYLPPELAQAIVDYREANGPLKTPEEITKVPGMTQDFVEELNPQEMDGDIVYDPDAEPALAPSKC